LLYGASSLRRFNVGVLCRQKKWTTGETGAVIITPTRELAAQVCEVCRSFLPPGLAARLIIGGRDVEQDVADVNEGASTVVVATPGRLLVLLSRNDCKLARHVQALEYLILDEADRLLELGFHQSLTSILQYLPKQRRTGLFSATLNSDVRQLMTAGLRRPVAISVREPGQDPQATAVPNTLLNYFTECGADQKLSTLVALLTALQSKKVMVFFSTCASVSYFSSLVSRLSPQLLVMALHGRMHGKRKCVFDRFSAEESGVLMCTDVAARGVDFPAVDWVLQYDPPSSANMFVHRSGRTARMGQEGHSLLFLTPSETSYVEFLRLNKGLVLESYPCPTAPCLRDRARTIICQDRELHQMGMRAFVSFVHFYYKHECKLIFQARVLNLLQHARGFALLRLPKMPELKKLDTSSFDPLPVPPASDPHGWVNRKRKRGSSTLTEGGCRGRKGHSQSYVKKQNMASKTSRSRKKRPHEFAEDELEELARDARALRKFKRGKISEEELDQQLHNNR
jgi:ATP-dependent RNA helicase DDX55/SPB4